MTYGLDQEMNWQSSRQGEYLECDLLLQLFLGDGGIRLVQG